MTFLTVPARKDQLMPREKVARFQPGRLPLHPLPQQQGQILGVPWGWGGIVPAPAAFHPYPWELTPPYRVILCEPLEKVW